MNMITKELSVEGVFFGLAIATVGIATIFWPIATAFELPNDAQWLVGWFLVGFGGWVIPSRLVAGIFIGFALAFETLLLLKWL